VRERESEMTNKFPVRRSFSKLAGNSWASDMEGNIAGGSGYRLRKRDINSPPSAKI